jgi:hypothetical protein
MDDMDLWEQSYQMGYERGSGLYTAAGRVTPNLLGAALRSAPPRCPCTYRYHYRAAD